jgi:hypothetical protein
MRQTDLEEHSLHYWQHDLHQKDENCSQKWIYSNSCNFQEKKMTYLNY